MFFAFPMFHINVNHFIYGAYMLDDSKGFASFDFAYVKMTDN